MISRQATERLLSDARFAVRGMRRSPLFTGVVVLILGLAIGMATAMFTVFESVLVHEFPIREQDRVVELSGLAGGAATESPISPAQLHRFRAQSRTLSGIAGMSHWRVLTVPLLDGEQTVPLRMTDVTDNFFDALGARPALGRLFHSGDSPEILDWSTASHTMPIVLSYGAWRRRFGGDSAVLGRHLREPKEGFDLVIVGVAPPGLDYPRGVELWMAYTYGSLDVVGRLVRGATPAAARNEFLGFLNHDPDFVSSIGTHALGAQVHTVAETVVGDAQPVIVILGAAVGLLMIVACTNVGALMLLRAAGRMREMAVRRAIGASVGDLVRQLLTECSLIALAAGISGVALARAFTTMLVRLAPSGLPRLDLLAVSGWPIAIAVGMTVLTILAFGLVPSLGALRFDLAAPLRATSRAMSAARGFVRARSALVAAQIGLAVVVLAGAGLLMRSLERLTSLDTGYATDHLALLSVSFPWLEMGLACRPHGQSLTAADSARWNQCANESNFDAHDRIMSQLRAVPGVVSVSPTAAPPFLGSNVWMIKIVTEEQAETEAKSNPWFGYDLVGAQFFRTLDLPMIEGRGFTDADREGAPRVAIVSEDVAHRLWPNQDVIGKKFHEPGKTSIDSEITIVGVVGDLHFREYRRATPTVFRPYRQVYAQGYFILRTRNRPDALFSAFRDAVRRAGAGLTLVSAESMDELIAPQLQAPRFETLLISLFASAALLLAAIGLYGVTASAVAQQRRELGIRLALGATPATLQRMVLKRAAMLVGAGAAAGLLASVLGLRLLRSMLFEISPYDPVTLMAVTALLSVIALIAAFSPARRATKIDPVDVLRAE